MCWLLDLGTYKYAKKKFKKKALLQITISSWKKKLNYSILVIKSWLREKKNYDRLPQKY